MTNSILKTTNKSGLEVLTQALDAFSLTGSNVGKVEGMALESRMVVMTPALAATILDSRNTSNRKISKAHVNLLAKFMENGDWDFNGDSIRFDENGVLIDGQHRLLAIIKSKTSQIVLILTGVEHKAFDTIDIGSKRSGSDIFSINNIKNETLTASVVKFIYAFKNGKFSANRNTIRNLSTHEIMDYYESLDNVQESIDFASKLKTKGQRLFTPSLLGGLHYLFSEVDADMADDFMTKLYVGVNLDENSPITPLRNKLFKAKIDKNFKLTNQSLLQTIVFVWDKYSNGKKSKTLRVPDDYEIVIK